MSQMFFWYDINTPDPKASAAFYSDVIGWTVAPTGIPDSDYQLFQAGKFGVGGIMPIPENACAEGSHPTWIGYVHVDDVDEIADSIAVAGGSILREPWEIPNIGRIAVVCDPQGAPFMIMKPDGPTPDEQIDPDSAGVFSWHELRTSDREAAFAFYSELFGWTEISTLDMGPAGIYQIFGVDGTQVGGMMGQGPDAPVAWLFYVTVDGLDAAIARAKQRGGKVVSEPQQVPGGNWVASCTDPHGAPFAMASRTR